MRFRRLILSLLIGAIAVPVHAGEPGLPDEAAVRGALDEHPSVAAARARVGSARAEAAALAKGPHEFTVTGSLVRRSVDREGDFSEYDLQLARPIRGPGKAALDREIGQYGVEASENLAEDAKHKAALVLATAWWDWLGAGAEAIVDRQAVENAEQLFAAVKRRVQLRDAAQLEADQAQAALESARVAAEESAARVSLARSRLSAQFPTLPLPLEPPEVPSPEAPEGGFERYRGLVLSESHEIAAAEAQARQASARAERVRRDRHADPSLGLRVFSERGGAEKGIGLLFSVPLGGGHRRALAEQASANASAARAEETQTRFDVRELADTDTADAQFRLQAWSRARSAVEAQVAALLKMRRGYQLGEMDLSDVLLSERMVHDAFRTEARARSEAQRAITRLRIDSHQLWVGD